MEYEYEQQGWPLTLGPLPTSAKDYSKPQWHATISHSISTFVVALLPTPEEMAVKEDVRKLLERLIKTIEPKARLLSFGSSANGLGLRNSDMDLCCLIDREPKDRPDASTLVRLVSELLERETKFHLTPLPHARIPIIKLSLPAVVSAPAPSPFPYGLQCDIGFENRLALENTRLLMSYASLDGGRVRGIVLFLKIWSKRRHLNSPFRGTLSSYGYVLLVLYFLVHVKNPPVLPNLQQIPPLREIDPEDMHLNGRNIWFFDDVDLLRDRWRSENDESVAELLIDFFKYFAKDFPYNSGVASLRAGLLRKDEKDWNDPSGVRNKLCIEDPFEVDFNVARSVTRDGLYIIRGEFMRALRLLTSRQERKERALGTIKVLCEEREEVEGELPQAQAPVPLFVPGMEATTTPAVAPTPAEEKEKVPAVGEEEAAKPETLSIGEALPTTVTIQEQPQPQQPVASTSRLMLPSPPQATSSAVTISKPPTDEPIPEQVEVPEDEDSQELTVSPISPNTSAQLTASQPKTRTTTSPHEPPRIEPNHIPHQSPHITPPLMPPIAAPEASIPSFPHGPAFHFNPLLPHLGSVAPHHHHHMHIHNNNNSQPLPHMAPRRARWTSPPPPSADGEVVKKFEEMMGKGLEIATGGSSARELLPIPISENGSGSDWDEEGSDFDAASVGSYSGRRRGGGGGGGLSGGVQIGMGWNGTNGPRYMLPQQQQQDVNGRKRYSRDDMMMGVGGARSSSSSIAGGGGHNNHSTVPSTPTRSNSTPRPSPSQQQSQSTRTSPSMSNAYRVHHHHHHHQPPRISSHPSLPLPFFAQQLPHQHHQQQSPYTIYQPVNMLQSQTTQGQPPMFMTGGGGYPMFPINTNTNNAGGRGRTGGGGASTQSSPAMSQHPNSMLFGDALPSASVAGPATSKSAGELSASLSSLSISPSSQSLPASSSTSPTSAQEERGSRGFQIPRSASDSNSQEPSSSRIPPHSFPLVNASDQFTFTPPTPVPNPHRRKHSYSFGASEVPHLTPLWNSGIGPRFANDMVAQHSPTIPQQQPQRSPSHSRTGNSNNTNNSSAHGHHHGHSHPNLPPRLLNARREDAAAHNQVITVEALENMARLGILSEGRSFVRHPPPSSPNRAASQVAEPS